MIMIDQAPWILYPSVILGICIAFFLPGEQRAIDKRSIDKRTIDKVTTDRGLNPITALEVLALLAITAVAFWLRFDGITFGLPNNFHPDEIPKLNAIERMRAAGDLNPRYFLHPSLLLYATHFTERLGEWFGWWPATRESLNLAGRTVSLVAGTLTIPALWSLARSTTGKPRVALLSAALLAVFPLHVTCSRYLKEDALVTFWMVVTAAIVMSTITNVTNPHARWRLLWAGFFAGVAASSKYTGLIFFVFVLLAPWLRSRDWRPDRSLILPAIAAVLLSAVGFVICSPYVVLDWSTFINDFMYEQRHMNKGHMVVISPWAHYWSYQIGRSVIPGISFVDTVLALVAAGCSMVLLFRDRSRTAFLCLVALGMTYLPAEMVKAKPEPQPDRYLMVCLPWCALLIAALFDWGLSDRSSIYGGLRRRSAVLFGVSGYWVFGILVVGIPLYRTLTLSNEIKDDTRFQMARWIEGNIPTGSSIAVDYQWYGPPLDPARYTVTSLHGAEILENIRIGELRKAKAGYKYLIISSFFKDRFFRQSDNLGAFRDLFRKLDRELPILQKINAPSGPYGFHNPGLTLYDLTVAN